MLRNKSNIRILQYVMLLFITISSSSAAQELTAAVGVTIPPYVMADKKSGMEYEIVSRAMKLCGHEIKPSFVPFGRMMAMVRAGAVQIAFPCVYSMNLGNVFFSEPHIVYRNVIITLKEKRYNFQSLSDLKGLYVAAFKGARTKLGPDYANAVSSFSYYDEIIDQKAQVNLLFFNRIDAIVSDINFFNYYLKERKQKEKNNPSKKVKVHDLLPPSEYSVCFINEAHRDEFNKALIQIKTTGGYEKIMNKFLND